MGDPHATLLAADEAEAAVIAAVLLRNDAIDEVRHVLEPDDFRVPKYRSVYEALLLLASDGYPLDLVHLERKMRAADTLGHVGGLDGLGRLADTGTSSYLATHHADLVRDASRRRRMRDAGNALIEAASGDDRRVDDIVAEHLRDADLLLSGDTDELVHAAAAMQHVADRTEHVQKSGEQPRMPTPLTRLNEHLGGGWWPTWYVLIAAAHKIGKSALGLAAATTAANAGYPVLYWSGEMPAADQGARLVTSTADIPAEVMRTREGPSGIDWAAIRAAIHRMRGTDFHLADGRGGINRIIALSRAWARRRKGKHGLIVIDYLQLIRDARAKGDTRAEEVATASSALKDLAVELGATVLVLAQLDNKAIENRPGNEPRIGDLRESQAPAMDCDLALLLNRPWLYNKKRPADLMTIQIGRARHVSWPLPKPIGAVFAGRTMSVGDRHDDDQQGDEDHGDEQTEKPKRWRKPAYEPRERD